MMTRKDYVEVARIIRDNTERPAGPNPHIRRDAIVNELADYFKRDNAAFDRARFIEACK